MRKLAQSSWSWTVAVAAVCGAVYVAIALSSYTPHTYLIGDSPYYAAAAASLIGDGDLRLENNLQGDAQRHAGFVSLGMDGEWRPKHPVLMSVASIPFLMAFGVNGLLIFNLLILTSLAAAAHRLAARGAAPIPASAAALITCLLTFVPAYAYNYSPDAFAALPALVALLLLLDGRSALSGVLFGLAFAAKPVHVLLLVIGAAVCVARGGLRSGARFLVGATPCILAVLLYNLVLFGGPLATGYERMMEPDAAGGVMSQREDFTLLGAPANLLCEIMDPRHGLLFTAPSVLLALAGLVPLRRRDRGAALLFLWVMTAYILFFATFVPWRASHFGNRFLFVPVLLSAMPLAALLGNLARRRFGMPRSTSIPTTTNL